MSLVALPPALRALHKALTVHDFQKSSELYNTLLDDADQPPVADQHVTNLANIFVKYNAHEVLGIHLIHGHFKIPSNAVMLGTNFDESAIRWAKATNIDSLNAADIHGHIFVLAENGLCAYEYQDGPLPDLSSVGQGFLGKFVEYIVNNNLTSLIGLQVLGCGHKQSTMFELILDQGTVMLDASIAKNIVPTRVTGWQFESVDGNPRVCAHNETHAGMTSGNHKVYNAGKPLPKLENIEQLKDALADVGLL
ncbi:hypothetical protein QBC40DRAFT_228193 [Triangularia verruculosa]|uniref:Uncharacterized protein n=1 Tax=Triangularia verruculosa TaxID=2587418 RepID=A0AAN7ATY4_9PEZI|nr:hypothetical protein QBC40DRAFT_228193 [Triangularia verruculosa]